MKPRKLSNWIIIFTAGSALCSMSASAKHFREIAGKSLEEIAIRGDPTDAEADRILRHYQLGKHSAEQTTQEFQQPTASIFPHFRPGSSAPPTDPAILYSYRSSNVRPAPTYARFETEENRGSIIAEPSGQEPQLDDPATQPKENESVSTNATDIEEPSGASGEVQQDPAVESDSGAEQAPERSSEVNEPAGAQPDDTGAYETKSREPQSQTGTDSAAQEIQKATNGPSQAQIGESEIAEPAGTGRDAAPTQKQAAEAEEKSLQQSIDEPAGASPSGSAQLQERIKTMLQSHSAIQNLQVTTANGKVILRGTVNSEEEKKRAEQQVKDFLVDNQLDVDTTK